MFWILSTGAPWRDLPPDYGDWNNTHRRFCCWRDRGVWNQLLDTVIDDPDFEWLMIDASYIRVHPNGTGTRGSNQVCQNRDVLPGNLPNPSTRHLDQAILTTRPSEFLEIPGDKDLVTVVAFGYPADWVAAGAKVRDILSETAHNERVGQTYEG